MSLYSDYKFEREGKLTIESAHGFATYSFNKDTCYIEDIYIIPEYRKSGLAKEMANWITKKAKDLGYKRLMGSVTPSNKESQKHLRLVLSLGMSLHSAQYDTIYFVKEL